VYHFFTKYVSAGELKMVVDLEKNVFIPGEVANVRVRSEECFSVRCNCSFFATGAYTK
jgi:hypothetical protein